MKIYIESLLELEILIQLRPSVTISSRPENSIKNRNFITDVILTTIFTPQKVVITSYNQFPACKKRMLEQINYCGEMSLHLPYYYPQ
jgi:hypothetical protein